MTRDAVVADRLVLLREIDSIAADILVLEARGVASQELDDYRRRVLKVRGDVMDQLRGLLTCDTETIH